MRIREVLPLKFVLCSCVVVLAVLLGLRTPRQFWLWLSATIRLFSVLTRLMQLGPRLFSISGTMLQLVSFAVTCCMTADPFRFGPLSMNVDGPETSPVCRNYETGL